jgi:hypothetical protein
MTTLCLRMQWIVHHGLNDVLKYDFQVVNTVIYVLMTQMAACAYALCEDNLYLAPILTRMMK